MSYSYLETMKSDIQDWIDENIDYIKDEVDDISDIDAVAEYLNDALWVEDSVTGNGSGSYTFDRAEAKENVQGDPNAMDYVKDLCDEFGEDPKTIAEKFMNDDWEWFDVSIRCYLLGQVIYEVLESGIMDKYQ